MALNYSAYRVSKPCQTLSYNFQNDLLLCPAEFVFPRGARGHTGRPTSDRPDAVETGTVRGHNRTARYTATRTWLQRRTAPTQGSAARAVGKARPSTGARVNGLREISSSLRQIRCKPGYSRSLTGKAGASPAKAGANHRRPHGPGTTSPVQVHTASLAFSLPLYRCSELRCTHGHPRHCPLVRSPRPIGVSRVGHRVRTGCHRTDNPTAAGRGTHIPHGGSGIHIQCRLPGLSRRSTSRPRPPPPSNRGS